MIITQKLPDGELFQIYLFLMTVFILRPWSRMLLRRRRLLGVTSRSSSSARNSRHCSRLICLGGIRRRASSEPEARVLVRCFVRQTFTATSSDFGHTPTIIPAYTFVPGVMNIAPRSCAFQIP